MEMVDGAVNFYSFSFLMVKGREKMLQSNIILLIIIFYCTTQNSSGVQIIFLF